MNTKSRNKSEALHAVARIKICIQQAVLVEAIVALTWPAALGCRMSFHELLWAALIVKMKHETTADAKAELWGSACLGCVSELRLSLFSEVFSWKSSTICASVASERNLKDFFSKTFNKKIAICNFFKSSDVTFKRPHTIFQSTRRVHFLPTFVRIKNTLRIKKILMQTLDKSHGRGT